MPEAQMLAGAAPALTPAMREHPGWRTVLAALAEAEATVAAYRTPAGGER